MTVSTVGIPKVSVVKREMKFLSLVLTDLIEFLKGKSVCIA